MSKGKLLYIPTLIIWIAFGACSISAQNSVRSANITIDGSFISADSLSILPTSIELNLIASPDLAVPHSIRNDSIFIDPEFAAAHFQEKLHLTYRVFALSFDKAYFHLDSASVISNERNVAIGYNSELTDGNKLINGDNLNYNGSFSRGFSVGNAQSLVLNSQFNLQLAGDLGNGIEVAAAISDDNIPIQPEGNTQRLQEFDRVFIKVSKGSSSILAGDFQLQRPKGYFTKYLKKLKGLSVQNTSEIANMTVESDASIAVSRGKFARQLLTSVEGNQGPYKLLGNNGERFLIVLSGTEKVYLDGRLLKRGYDHDYIIDYNSAEVVFTARTLVRRESRFIVEFEYTDQSYLRTLYAINSYITSSKWDLNLNFYSEQDSKSASGDNQLDSLSLSILSTSGDDLSLAVRSGIFSSSDTINTRGRVTYVLIDNPDQSDPVQQILSYTDDTSQPLVTAVFTEVGQGLGTYAIDENVNTNGRVYKYVGAGSGAYEPVIRILPPEKKQILSLGSKYKISQRGHLGGELSLSSTDINRLSDINNEDNDGYAANVNHEYQFDLGSSWDLRTNSNFEILSNDYRFLNPYRPAEFSRDWNLPNTLQIGQQTLAYAGLGLQRTDSLKIDYTLGHLDIQEEYDGTIHKLEGHVLTDWGFQTNSKLSALTSTSLEENSSFIRVNSTSKQFLSQNTGLAIGLFIDTEQNERTDIDSGDILNPLSNGYRIYQLFAENKKNTALTYRASYSHRIDLQPDQKHLATSLNTDELSAEVGVQFSPTHNLEVVTSFRDLQIKDEALAPTGTTAKQTILSQIAHNISLLKGGIIANSNYLVSSGQQPKVEFFFERVPAGQGEYIYIGTQDSTQTNSDFRFAPDLGTADYVKFSTVNGEFITTNNQNLSHSLRLSPEKFWSTNSSSQNRWWSIISKLSTFSTVRIDKKVLAEENVSYFDLSRGDSSIVQYNGLISNSLFINKGNRAYDLQITQRSTGTIFTQISGLEERTDDNYNIRSRLQIWKSSDLIVDYTYGKRTYTSEQLEIRNFDIRYNEFSPKISFRPTDNWRIIFEYGRDSRRQVLKRASIDQENATSNSFSIDLTLRQPTNYSIAARASYVNVDFNGIPGSIMEFDLLRGLRDGKNVIGNILISKRLQNSIDLSVSYEGRKNGSSPIIHIARAQVKATF